MVSNTDVEATDRKCNRMSSPLGLEQASQPTPGPSHCPDRSNGVASGRPTMNENRIHVTVYLEDTDALGMVYHANYLKYCERGRTELLKDNGYAVGEMQRQGALFVVFEMKLRFQRPARLHDVLEVRSRAVRSSDYRITFTQEVCRQDIDRPLFVAESAVVTIDLDGQLCPLPDGLLEG